VYYDETLAETLENQLPVNQKNLKNRKQKKQTKSDHVTIFITTISGIGELSTQGLIIIYTS